MTASIERRASAKGQRRREAILQTAWRLFAHPGYGQTSVQDIADDVGLLKGSLYYYYESKEHILFDVLLQNHRRLYDEVVARGGYARPAGLEDVRTFVDRHVTYVLRNPEICALYAEEQGVVRSRPQWLRELGCVRRRHEAALRDLIADAVDAGVAEVDDGELTTRALLSMANGAHRWYRSTQEPGISVIAEHHAALAIRSLRPTTPADVGIDRTRP